MVNWFLWGIVILLILVIFFFVKLRYIKHKLLWILILITILILYIGFMISTSGKDINLKTFEGTSAAIRLYLTWLGQSFDNLKILTGQATKLDWGANSTVIKDKINPLK